MTAIKRGAFVCWLLLLVLLPNICSAATINKKTNTTKNDDGGGAVTRSTAGQGEGDETAAARNRNSEREFVKPAAPKEKSVTVILEIGGLDLHWKDAGVFWRIEEPSAAVADEEQHVKERSGEFPWEKNSEKAEFLRRRTLEYNSRKGSAHYSNKRVGVVAGDEDALISDRPPSPPGRTSAFPSSDKIQHRIVNRDGTHVMFKFKLSPQKPFRLILETSSTTPRKQDLLGLLSVVEGASPTATNENIPTAGALLMEEHLRTAVAFVSMTMDNGVSLLHAEGVDLLSGGTTHTFEDLSVPSHLHSTTYRGLQNDAGDNRVQEDLDKATLPPKPAPTVATPAPGPVNDAGDTRPPSYITNSPTQAETCIAPTVTYDSLYWAIRLTSPMSNVGDLANAELLVLLAPILTGLVETYTAIATCEQEGAYRTMTLAELVETHRGGTTSSEVEVIVRLTGSCVGCPFVPIELFKRRAQEEPAVNDTASGNRRELAVAPPCFCPGPTRRAFIQAYNTRNQANELGPLLDVVDVERVEECTTGMSSADFQQHTAAVSVVLTRDPEAAGADVSAEEQDAIIANFVNSFHQVGSFAEGTCDLARRTILAVRPDDDTNTRQRNRRLPDTAQTSDDVELFLQVTFECFGCKGQLFGMVNVQNSSTCLCPIEIKQQGVPDQGLIGPLTQALRDVVLGSGGTSDIELSQVVPEMGLATSTQVADVMQVKEVSCASSFSLFSDIVVVEYELIANTTTSISENDIGLLETQFVKGYNGLARRYCDPYFRRLSSAEALFYQISNDGSIASFEISVVGTCRGACNETLPVYDPEAFRRNKTEPTSLRARKLGWKPNHRTLRRLQLDSTTCYCSTTSSEDLGPSEPEVIQNYGALVNRFELETISEVAECKFLTTFRRAILLNISGSADSEEELNQLGQTFVDNYKNQTLNGDRCDPLFRQLTGFEIFVNVTEGVALESTGNRKLWARIALEQERRAQLSSLTPSMSPTMSSTGELGGLDLNISDPTFAPSLPFDPISSVSSESQLLLLVTGTCRGCTSDSDLFDQPSARRNLQEDGEDAQDSSANLVKESVDSCFCPPTSKNVAVTEEDLVRALSTLPFVDGVTLEEVEIVECALETTTFETTIVIDASVNGDVTSDDAALLGSTLIYEYNLLSVNYCDELFRRPETVVSAEYTILREPDQNGISRVLFFFNLGGSCRGCSPNEDLFDNRRDPGPGRRRRMQVSEENRCYCRKDAKNGAIEEGEFEEAFRDVVQNARRRQLQDQGVPPVIPAGRFEIFSVWQAPELARGESLADAAASLFESPNGYSQWKDCKVPDGTERRIGDGYCDRDIVSKSDPPEYIYNVASCGWDGGDCCEATCEDWTFDCGEDGFDCRSDGSNLNILVERCTTYLTNFLGGNLALLNSVGDGVCNNELNVIECAFDNKDCCRSTCTTPQGQICSDTQFYNCTDTTLVCLTPIGDGWCDLDLNDEANDFDGGDCCPDTCTDDCFTCGEGGFVCYDPRSRFYRAPPPDGCKAEPSYWIGDGYCDSDQDEHNTAECNWDGGDCCPDTCNSTVYPCGLYSDYDCENPESPFWEDEFPVDSTYFASLDCIDYLQDRGRDPDRAIEVGDGWCAYHDPWNTEVCGYDGGDCCPSTCKSAKYRCGRIGFVCLAQTPLSTLTVQVVGRLPGGLSVTDDRDDYRDKIDQYPYEEFESTGFYDASPNNPPTVYISFWFMIYWCPASSTWNFALNWDVYSIQTNCETQGIQSAVVDIPTTPCDADWLTDDGSLLFVFSGCPDSAALSAGAAAFLPDSSLLFLDTLDPSTEPTTTPIIPSMEPSTKPSDISSLGPTDAPTPLASDDPTQAPQP